ncbi:MAG: ACT domain-containing protein [Thermodesulfovibrionales bacterium]|nr:ACT domain-containing protein [Thermodesulfovibrionales bacterium]
MPDAKVVKQFVFSLPNRTGLAGEITTTLADANINISAFAGYEMGDSAEFMLICDQMPKAKKILQKMGAELKEEQVIEVQMPNKVGELKTLTGSLGNAGININYIYGTTGSPKSSVCILKTADNKKAVKTLSTKPVKKTITKEKKPAATTKKPAKKK